MDTDSEVNILMSAESRRQWVKITKRYGMTQKTSLGRLVTWFVNQHELVQSVALGQLPPEHVGNILKLIRPHDGSVAEAGADRMADETEKDEGDDEADKRKKGKNGGEAG